MDEAGVERHLQNIDLKLDRVVQFLPTLVTKAELSGVTQRLERIEQVLPTLATKVEMSAVTQRLERVEEVLPTLATKPELVEEGDRTRRHTDALVERSIQDANALFEGSREHADALVDGSRQHAEALFEGSRQHAEALFERSRQHAEALFEHSLQHADTLFERSTQHAEALFEGSRQHTEALFEGSQTTCGCPLRALDRPHRRARRAGPLGHPAPGRTPGGHHGQVRRPLTAHGRLPGSRAPTPEATAATAARIVRCASHGSVTSTNAQRPKPPWLLTAGTHNVRAVLVLAALSFRASPDTSMMRLSASGWV